MPPLPSIGTHGLVARERRRQAGDVDGRACRAPAPDLASGTSTNARCHMRGCGRVSSGSSVSTPFERASISTSSVRGPNRRSRTRPARVSIAWQARSSSQRREAGLEADDLVEEGRLVGQVLGRGLVDARDGDQAVVGQRRERVARRAQMRPRGRRGSSRARRRRAGAASRRRRRRPRRASGLATVSVGRSPRLRRGASPRRGPRRRGTTTGGAGLRHGDRRARPSAERVPDAVGDRPWRGARCRWYSPPSTTSPRRGRRRARSRRRRRGRRVCAARALARRQAHVDDQRLPHAPLLGGDPAAATQGDALDGDGELVGHGRSLLVTRRPPDAPPRSHAGPRRWGARRGRGTRPRPASSAHHGRRDRAEQRGPAARRRGSRRGSACATCPARPAGPARRSGRGAASRSRLCSSVLPKPMPGSSSTCSSAHARRDGEREPLLEEGAAPRRRRRRSAGRPASSCGSPSMCMRQTGQPASATTPRHLGVAAQRGHVVDDRGAGGERAARHLGLGGVDRDRAPRPLPRSASTTGTTRRALRSIDDRRRSPAASTRRRRRRSPRLLGGHRPRPGGRAASGSTKQAAVRERVGGHVDDPHDAGECRGRWPVGGGRSRGGASAGVDEREDLGPRGGVRSG